MYGRLIALRNADYVIDADNGFILSPCNIAGETGSFAEIRMNIPDKFFIAFGNNVLDNFAQKILRQFFVR